MGDNSSISWTESSWSPVTGCAKVSPGCDNCYAVKMSHRLHCIARADQHNVGAGRYYGVSNGKDWTGKVRLHWDVLGQPVRWRKPRKIFVCSMSDWMHHDVPDKFIDAMMEVMTKHAPHHVYQLLTKRTNRLATVAGNWQTDQWRHLHVGFTAENQKWFDRRWADMKDFPAYIIWVSIEPMLGRIVLPQSFLDRAPYVGVVCGGESGPNARPMHPNWARSLRNQCVEAGVSFHFKQHGAYLPGAFDPSHDSPARAGTVSAWTTEHSTDRREVGKVSYYAYDASGRAQQLDRVGKKAAGRELDGRIWDEWPY